MIRYLKSLVRSLAEFRRDRLEQALREFDARLREAAEWRNSLCHPEVGVLQHSDLRAQVDRLTYRYRSAIAFAKVLLKGSGTRIAHGATHGWCFLIRTPELVEAGVRAVLKQHLGPYWRIEKRGRTIRGASFSINPDLVFGESVAIGDIKYKLLASDWSRADLYQAVAFAAGYQSEHALVIGFAEGESAALPPAVAFGRIDVEAVAWDARLECEPEESGRRLSAWVGERLVRSARPTERAQV